MSYPHTSHTCMAASFLFQALREGREPFARLAVLILSCLAFLIVTTGCSEASYRAWLNQPKGSSQPGEVIALPFILIEEIYLLGLRTEKENAAMARANEQSAQERRFGELQGLVLRGDKALQYELAFCYLHGRGTTHNAAQAAFWYEKSAMQGFAEAQNDLGLCYFNEIGVRWDKVEACAWWTLAASAHDDARQSLLFAESEAGRRLTPEAFTDFEESVRRRAAELRALIGRRGDRSRATFNDRQPEAAQAR